MGCAGWNCLGSGSVLVVVACGCVGIARGWYAGLVVLVAFASAALGEVG